MDAHTPKKSLIIYTDGACRKKGVQGSGDAAIAYKILDSQGDVLVFTGKRVGMMTNNASEYTAVITALADAAHHSEGDVTLHSDSELLVRQMTGVYRVKDKQLKEFFEKVKRKEVPFKSVTYVHVPREDPHITDCDRLANERLDGR